MLSRSMETNISSETPHPFYGPGASDYNGIGKKSLEWDLNEWKWDGDLFVATPLNAGPSDCRNKKRFPVPVFQGISNTSSSSSGETDSGSNAKGKGDSEKRRRVVVVEDDEPYDKDGSLTLKLGGHVYPITDSDLTNWDGKNDKKGKVQGGNSNRAMCQVEGCGANLSDAKDYHRRHKVCEMHAKASQALVGNATQRFCQQCSRFHLLQEFDEGKRSCRRRLAGHNKRRRKTLPDTVANGSSLADDRASGYLLISLLRILSNLHSDRSGQSNDQDLLPHLLKNLASLAGSFDERNLSGLLQASQDMQKTANFAGPSSDSALALRPNGISAQESSRPLCSTTKMNCNSDNHDSSVRPFDQSMSGTVTAVEVPSKGNNTETSHIENFQDVPHRRSTNPLAVQDGFMAKPDVLCSINQVLPVGSVLERAESTLEKVRLKNFDLNSTYDDGPDTVEGLEKLATPANMGTASLSYPSWLLQDSRQASPPQTSGNSDSASAQSLSSSNGDAQSRTDRIVFKLFGKDPSDFPLILRSQILNWLSNSPTEIESYIRPGCIILTIYLRLAVPTWEELCSNLSSSMKRLLDVAGNDFWRIGWVYVRLHHRMAFIYNGKVVLDAPLPTESRNDCKIVSVTPIAVTISGTVDFKVKGFNLARSSMRLLCAFEGKYLVEETTQALIDGTDAAGENDGSECLSFSCFAPNFTGRGFIEVEDHGLSSGFFPFIVAEHDVCTEIRMLENTINVNWIDGNLQERMAGTKARTQALDFLHEIGWLLRRNHLRSRSENMNSCSDIFSLTRFKWLMEFSMNHDWCAVVKKLLDILYGGSIDAGGHSVELLLSDMSLLHSAVRRNCRPMVEFLLRYVPAKALEKVGSPKAQDGSGPIKFFFRPDTVGPSNVTPLHIAATRGDAESMLDALTDDPGRVGITAWKYARDDTGFTPEDYARVRGFESYLELVNKKDDLKSGAGHVVLNMPGDVVTKKQKDGKSIGFGLQIEQSSKMKPKQQPYCKRCSQQLAYRTNRSSLLYRPVMLAMVGIAAVCVCVGLLLKGPPEVLCVFQPFNWELLDYGPI